VDEPGVEDIAMGDLTRVRGEHVVQLREQQTLDQVIEQRGLPVRCLMLPFAADWRGERVLVTGVLERTAVVHRIDSAGGPEDRVLARRPDLMVEAGRLRWTEAGKASCGRSLVHHGQVGGH
jgi:hypothetical protein